MVQLANMLETHASTPSGTWLRVEVRKNFTRSDKEKISDGLIDSLQTVAYCKVKFIFETLNRLIIQNLLPSWKLHPI